jgi:RNA-directed DNA polymerase
LVAFSFPSKRGVTRLRHRIKELTGRATTNLTLDALIHALNPVLRSWTTYYRHATSKHCFAYLDHYLWRRLVGWLRKKHPRLTWKQIRRRYWSRAWTTHDGARIYWPSKVAVTRYMPRRLQLPCTTSRTTGPPAGRSVVAT